MTMIKIGQIVEVISIQDKMGRTGGCVIVEFGLSGNAFQYTILLGGLPAIVCNEMEDVEKVVRAFKYDLYFLKNKIEPVSDFHGCIGSDESPISKEE